MCESSFHLHPEIHSLLSSALPLPGPVFLSWVFTLISWILISLGGRLMPSFTPGHERCRMLSTKGYSLLSPAGKGNLPALIQHLLLGEPAGWMNWGHRGKVSCACPAAGWLHLLGLCVKADLGEGFVFSLVLWPFSWLDTCPLDNPTASCLSASPRCQKHVPISSPLTWGILQGLVRYNPEKLCLTQFGGSEARSWARLPDVFAIVIKNIP